MKIYLTLHISLLFLLKFILNETKKKFRARFIRTAFILRVIRAAEEHRLRINLISRRNKKSLRK